MWQLQRIDVNGGFLPGLRIEFPPGLTCIIGPRGSGKSTLAEVIRFALCGSSGATKNRLELLQANLGSNGLITAHARTDVGVQYTIKRAYKQPPVIAADDGRTVNSVDLDRGTFLPLDSYNFVEIESIADETLGEKRRALLDDLRSDELHAIQLALNEQKRTLDSNADQIRSQRRALSDLGERIEDLADARTKLLGLGPSPEGESTNEYARASKQHQTNLRERERLNAAGSRLAALRRGVEAAAETIQSDSLIDIVEPASANSALLRSAEDNIRKSLLGAQQHVEHTLGAIDLAEDGLSTALLRIDDTHSKQAAEYTRLTELSEAAGALIRERTFLEQQVAQLEQLQTSRQKAAEIVQKLQIDRASARALYLSERERISTLRQSVAENLEAEAGENVRIRVMRHADDLAYRQSLLNGLRGARVRNHDDILASLLTLRPEQLAQVIEGNDIAAFDDLMGFGTDRSRKILDALRDNLDPLELEFIAIEDRIRIELNVSTGSEPNYKDAADLSRGQKCTALLPLLLARRDSPLIIDQPEDNLDNHFIYETIVGSINRLKARRQMIFITHNANIPVLAEAELVVVMNSDGRIGYVEKSGTVDECRDEVIDLLEGGEEAFALRSQRYARR